MLEGAFASANWQAVLIVAFGVVLPAFTLALELLTGACGNTLFDPMPTAWHIVLIALVPVANLLAFVALTRGSARHVKALSRLNGIAIGVALYYALAFLVITPFAVIGILWFGIGLIPLSPLISLIVAFVLRRKLRKMPAAGAQEGLPGLWSGLAVAFVAFFLLAVPRIITVTGMHVAAGDHESTRIRGIRMLRRFGSKEILLRSCYRGDRLATDIPNFVCNFLIKPVPAKEVRDIYYRVTGTPFNAVKPPNITGIRGGALINADEFDFGQGGDDVAARVRGLSLEESRIDTAVSPDGCTAYTEWTLVFKNDSTRQREARAQIALPPGGVVSRLTLWIDGEEREAAYSKRGKVKEAYKRVVQRRRDPVLVTTSGPDQVLLQCFPVPPNGGTMKVKVGITAPLVLGSYSAGLLRLPYFSERNFSVSDELSHAVWVESKDSLEAMTETATLITEHPSENLYAVRGKLTEQQLENAYTIRAQRDAKIRETWTKDDRARKPSLVIQTIREEMASRPQRVAVVIDGSRRMSAYAAAVGKALEHLPEDIELSVLLASDKVVELCAPQPSTSDARSGAAEEVERIDFVGGCDNVPALIEAWDAVAGVTNSAILWLHATQPIELCDGEQLVQKWERRPGNPELYDLQFGNGPNRIAEKLNGLSVVRGVPKFGDAAAGLQRLFAFWSGSAKRLVFDRKTETGDTRPTGTETGFDTARLWADGEVRELADSWHKGDRAAAESLASTYQLVTPVSGAVVLESEQQYKEAGLTPVSPETSPHIIPEPGTCGILITGVVLLLVRRYRRIR